MAHIQLNAEFSSAAFKHRSASWLKIRMSWQTECDMNRFKKPAIHLAQYIGTVCYVADGSSQRWQKNLDFSPGMLL
jgi:hypothetical protein